MKLKVKFPILFEHKPQFLTFMKFLEKNGVKWRNGGLPTDIGINSSMKFPTYILYHKLSENKLAESEAYITYLNQEDSDWFRYNYNNYFDGEVEFEN